jgi:alpha-mannosidase
MRVEYGFEREKTDSAKKIPELACSFDNGWDLLCASLAETSASVKRSIERLRAAEAMAVLAIQADPAFVAEYEKRRGEREQVWLNLRLYFERGRSSHRGEEERDAGNKTISGEGRAFGIDLPAV